ncbi:MAG: DUF3536 domain-containing protein [Syntrophobacteraceae bacterium]|nr:DUF3536 domain-containing protein [Syntrophobacteraceae bacterium]
MSPALPSHEIKYVCLHGHFYQPPRENPWLEAVETEESADPYHNWNERIHIECYRANTAARLVGEKNRVLRLRNNYRSLSFNFGATLLRWMEEQDPWSYGTILAADREVHTRTGHGNAVALAYNHMILPLANRRDQVTQVRWGVLDFEHRFGRRPEGMWLPETAVSRETLGVLADEGIRYTILSPHQASRWRFLDETEWRDARDGGIPTGRAYRFDCGRGRGIRLFFYDAALAKGIAFERLLEHSSRLLNRIQHNFDHRDRSRREPWLVHTATDGESYGHHFKFGDMALAAAFEELDRDPSAEVLNYGRFLSMFPTVAEVEIRENTAWSCVHGLGRWERDCGCRIGDDPGWNQQWRAPLREALNRLRDSLALHYEKEMARLSSDPWEARNDYIRVVLNPGGERDKFLNRHTRFGPAKTDVPRFFQLLEMQRCSMLMFTSCGWFFDEISGLETRINLKYAARAIQLARKTGAPPLEESFLAILEKAPSNRKEFGNGAEVYRKKVQPEVVEFDRVVANHAIRSLAKAHSPVYRLYCFQYVPQKEEDLGSYPARSLYGYVRVRDTRTLEEADFLYAALHFGGLDFRCSVKPYGGDAEYQHILASLEQSMEEQNMVNTVRFLDQVFGTTFFNLQDAFRDIRSSVAIEISQQKLRLYRELQQHFFQTHQPLLVSLRQWGIQIPRDVQGAIRSVLGEEVRLIVREILEHRQEYEGGTESWEDTDFFYRVHMGRLNTILESARGWRLILRPNGLSAEVGNVLVECLSELGKGFDTAVAGRLVRLLAMCKKLNLQPETWKLQTLFFEMVRTALKHPELYGERERFRGFVERLDESLGCDFARLLSAPVLPLSICPVHRDEGKIDGRR